MNNLILRLLYHFVSNKLIPNNFYLISTKMNQSQVNRTSWSLYSEMVADANATGNIVLESTLLDDTFTEKKNSLSLSEAGKNTPFASREKTMYNDIWYT